MDIRWLVLDVDGVLTDGTLIYTSEGTEIKSFSAKDGLGLTAARKSGLKLGIITGRKSPMVERRALELKFDEVMMGHSNKTLALQELCKRHQVSLQHIAYMGDDLNDLGPISLVGLPMAPNDAVQEIKDRAQFVSTFTGGHGAVREAVEFILKMRGQWDSIVDEYAREAHDHGQ